MLALLQNPAELFVFVVGGLVEVLIRLLHTRRDRTFQIGLARGGIHVHVVIGLHPSVRARLIHPIIHIHVVVAANQLLDHLRLSRPHLVPPSVKHRIRWKGHRLGGLGHAHVVCIAPIAAVHLTLKLLGKHATFVFFEHLGN